MRNSQSPLEKKVAVSTFFFFRLCKSKMTSQPARGLSVFTGTSAAESERSLQVLISHLAVFACGAR